MSLVVKLGADLREFEKGMRKATKEINQVSKTIGNVGKNMTKYLTLPILGVATAATKVGMDFEKSMSEVQAISGATGDDLQALEEAAREMGRRTSKSASESADALKYMSLAGWDAKTSIEALEPILRLSEAGNIDLGRASDLVTDSMSALGMEVSQLPGYLDMLAKASASSNTNIDALMEAMLVAGGTFKNLNVPMEEANAILGILANRGKKGSEAGNALNSIMVNLTSGAGRAGEAMEALNLSAFDAEGNFKGMSEVLKELAEKTNDMTQEQKTMYLSMLGGKTQLDTLQALLSGVTEEYDGLQDAISDSDGALNEMAATMQDNARGAITRLMSALGGLALDLAETLIPMVEKIIAKIQDWVDWFSELDDSTKEMIIKVGLVVAAIGPMLVIISKAILIFGKLKAAAMLLAPAIGAITLPIALKIAAVMALIAAGVALYKNWDTIKEYAAKTWEAIKSILVTVIDFVKENWKQLLTLLVNPFAGALALLYKLNPDFRNWINNLVGLVADKAKEFFDIGENIVKGLWDGIASMGGWVKDKITGFASSVADGFKSFFRISSPSRLMQDFGRYIAIGLADGIEDEKGKPEHAAVELAKVVGEAFSKVGSAVGRTVAIIEKEFQLWSLQNEELAGTTDELTQKLDMQEKKLPLLADKVSVAEKALNDIIAEYGEGSEQAEEYTQKLLDAKIAHVQLANEISKTTAEIERNAQAQAESNRVQQQRSTQFRQDYFSAFRQTYTGSDARALREAGLSEDVIRNWAEDQARRKADPEGEFAGVNINQNIQINSPEPLDEAKVAKNTQQVNRQLALEWGS